MPDLLREFIRLALQETNRSSLSGSHPEEQYEPSNPENLMLDKPGSILEPDVRNQVGTYLSKMGLMGGKTPRKPKGPKRKTRLG